jgi:hypothetical protein
MSIRRGQDSFRVRRDPGTIAKVTRRTTSPVCRLQGQVTADVIGGAARRWGGFRVRDDAGVEGLRSTLRRYSRLMQAERRVPVGPLGKSLHNLRMRRGPSRRANRHKIRIAFRNGSVYYTSV